MTNQKFIDTVVGFYSKAKHRTGPFALPDTIKRGRNHPVSSLTEDLLAYFITQRCNLQGYSLLVDYPISYTSELKRAKGGKTATRTMYPDIAVVKNAAGGPLITAIIDLKMDLGWMRELDGFLPSQLTILEELRTLKKATYQERDVFGVKLKKPGLPILVSPTMQMHIVVISSGNTGARVRAENKEHALQEAYYHKINTYVFAEGHANSATPPIINEEVINNFVTNISGAQ